MTTASRPPMTPRQRSTLGAIALLLAVPVVVLLASVARGLPQAPEGPIPDWTPASGEPAH